jgi:membrane protease subunit HflK
MPWNADRPNGAPNPWGVPPTGGGREPPNDRGNGRPGGPRGPWGGGGGGGGTPPDIDAVIGRAQAWVRSLLPPGFGGGSRHRGARFSGGRGAVLLLAILVVLWLASGFYRVEPDEQGVVLRFGAYTHTTLPGLNYHLPWPIETVLTPAVTRINRLEVGYRSSGGARVEEGVDTTGTDVLQESLMLTGDENIVDIDFAVFWRIRDAFKYLFNTRNPDHAVAQVAESVMRQVVGRTPIQQALTSARAAIESDVMTGEQAVLDAYGTGIEITQVQLQKVDPPADVIESFRDVQRANTDADRARNEAQAYSNDIVPRARGDAAAITFAADAQRQAAVAQATGESQRFLSVLKAYDAAKAVTLQRLYIETMQDVLTHSPTVVIDDQLKGIVPYLPLGGLDQAARPAAAVSK